MIHLVPMNQKNPNYLMILNFQQYQNFLHYLLNLVFLADHVHQLNLFPLLDLHHQ
jgi:hypothetical protein